MMFRKSYLGGTDFFLRTLVRFNIGKFINMIYMNKLKIKKYVNFKSC